MQLLISITFCSVLSSTILYAASSHLLIKTSKLCVEYRALNSRWNDTVLSVKHSVKYPDCLIQCTRHPRCSAFNFWSNTDICELLPAIGDCAETQAEEGSTFVHLGDCFGRVSWEVGRRNWSSEDTCHSWEPHDATKSATCPSGALKIRYSWGYCLALKLHKGMYLPGWYEDRGAFRFVTQLGTPKYCRGIGYLLRVAPECPTQWQDYWVGDPVPSQAIQVSTWKDGTPLYFVSAHFVNTWYAGYYLPSVQRSYFMLNKVRNPSFVSILVYVWEQLFPSKHQRRQCHNEIINTLRSQFSENCRILIQLSPKFVPTCSHLLALCNNVGLKQISLQCLLLVV